MTKVKICGITNLEDAVCASELSASFIGMIFYSESPRYINYETVSKIVSSLPDGVIPVGVFVEPTREEIISAIEQTGITAVQIHSNSKITDLNGLNVIQIRAYGVNDLFDFNSISENDCDYLLLDNSVKGQYGGTGGKFNWNNIPASIDRDKLILAGGLNPENVGDAIHIVMPSIVDVSSGVESSPGIKDKFKLSDFFKSVELANSGF